MQRVDSTELICELILDELSAILVLINASGWSADVSRPVKSSQTVDS